MITSVLSDDFLGTVMAFLNHQEQIEASCEAISVRRSYSNVRYLLSFLSASQLHLNYGLPR